MVSKVGNIIGQSHSDDSSLERFPADVKASVKDIDGIKHRQRGSASANNSASSNRNRQTHSTKGKRDLDSFQDVIFESFNEARRVQGDLSNSNLLIDTMKDIRAAASLTIASIRGWSDNSDNKGGNSYENEAYRATSESGGSGRGESAGWDDFAKMKNALVNSVQADSDEANDIWRFMPSSKDEDDNTVGTFDTLQEDDNNMIRRLGSWNTINTMETTGTAATNGTYDTGFNTDTRYEDDDGNEIDPKLIEKAQRAREKRSTKRKKLVVFDYPPVKQLRQYQRPDPKYLPNMFFTEHELDQIEGDRYSTMSTDDIEIVAVVSKNADRQASQLKGNPAPSGSLPEMRSSKDRPSTPHRRRHPDDDKEVTKSSNKNGRLVKGVQIFLRERSMGV